tara:strand:+ start:62 stop:511 length:450 start_codon:yes stop_codon:yes gene_type:complete
MSDKDKDMDSQDRRMMRHSKEQKRNEEAAKAKWEKSVDQADKAKELYGKKSSAYKKLHKAEIGAYSNWQMSQGLKGPILVREKRKKTPSGRMMKRQSKETTTEKDMDVGTSGQHPGTTKRKGSFNASGGLIKKNYAYGGRVAQYSAEKS